MLSRVGKTKHTAGRVASIILCGLKPASDLFGASTFALLFSAVFPIAAADRLLSDVFW